VSSGDPEIDTLVEQVTQVHGEAAVANVLLRAMLAVPGGDSALLMARLPQTEDAATANLARRDQVLAIFKAGLRQLVRPQ
jgi:hypothetical protein